MHLEQILVGRMAVFAYFIGCPETKLAALVDPAGEEEILLDKVEQAGYQLKYVINTHGHADHVCGNQKIKDLTGVDILVGGGDLDLMTGPRAQMWAQMGFTPSPKPDRLLKDGEVIELGQVKIECRSVPGHSPGSMALVLGSDPINVITGDALFVGAIGRTDLPGGSLEMLLKSINEKILSLPEDSLVWPGHHYGPRPSSTVGDEKRTNPYLTDFL